MSVVLEGRVVVVSPHLDDAVLSLGATIAGSVQAGAVIEALTVFAGDPDSQAPAGPWDTRSGFETEGHASLMRREEDRVACAILGMTPHWLSYADEQYDRHGDERTIGAAVAGATRGADVVLLPGAPLVNPDHIWLTLTLLRQGLDCRRVGLYAEQPYVFQQRRSVTKLVTSAHLQPMLRLAPQWLRNVGTPATRRDKLRALSAYRSQLRQLGLGFFGRRQMLRHEWRTGGEALAWL